MYRRGETYSHVSWLIRSYWLYVYIIHHTPTQVRCFSCPVQTFVHTPSVLELARIVTQLGRLTNIKFICHFNGLPLISTEMLKGLTVLIENIPSSHLVCRG